MARDRDWLPLRIFNGVSELLGNLRRLFLPLGIASLVAVGVHLGSEVVVHGVFVALGVLDRLFEAIVDGLLAAVEASGWPEEGWAERNAYAFAAWIDIDTRESLSKVGGVLVEIGVDVVLVRAALGWGEPTTRLEIASPDRGGFRRVIDTTRIQVKRVSREVRDYFKDITVEKVYLPLASVCAVLTGCYAIGLAVENALFEWLMTTYGTADHVFWLTTVPAIAVGVLLAWRLGWRMVVHAFAWAEARNERAHLDGLSESKRRVRGLIPALIVVPVMLAAVLVGTPVGALLGVS